MEITRRLVDFVLQTSLEEVPQEVTFRAKELILNQIGVTLAGSVQPEGKIIIDYVRHMGGNPQATVLGANFKTSSSSAALANGTSAHALDYDDTNLVCHMHPSPPTVPAVFAFGEEIGASGKDVLEAYILGLEAGNKLGQGYQPAQIIKGWHSTGTLGIIMCTAACIKMARLGPQEAARAFGIAASLAGALRGNFGTMTKPLHAGAAAMEGIIATSLAKRGYTAHNNIFERKCGYLDVLAGTDNIHLDVIEEWLESSRYSIIDPGIGVKLHSCNSAAFSAIDSTIEMVKQYDIKPEQVESIDCGQTPVAIEIACIKEPRTGQEAKYSLNYPIAVSVVDREAGIKQFTDERVSDPVVRNLMAKVKIYVHPDLANRGTQFGLWDVPVCHLTIRLKDGQEFTKYRVLPKGYPGGEPITHTELLDKYRKCAALVLPKDNIDRCIELVDRLEAVPHISELTGLLSVA